MTPRTLTALAQLGRALGILAGLWLLSVHATRVRHQAAGPLLSDVKAAHQRLLDAVHAAGPLIDFGDQTCPGCGREHPGAECAQPSLLEET